MPNIETHLTFTDTLEICLKLTLQKDIKYSKTKEGLTVLSELLGVY